MIVPTLHPLADVNRRYKETPDGPEAEMSNEEALTHVSESGHTWWEINNQASALYLTGRTSEALMTVRRAISKKRTLSTLTNMAVILETLGHFEAALPYNKEAAFCDPNDGRAEARYGEALLRLGRLAEGWPHYARQRAAHGWLQPFVKEWEGPHQDLKGKRLLVIEGGGYGDNIYFLRWLADLRRWGASIDYICQPDFAPLVRHLGYRAIENYTGNLLTSTQYDDYDYFTSVLALGWKLGVTLETYKWQGPYIKCSTWNILRRIGICWQAGEVKSPRKQRSLAEDQVTEILDHLPSCIVVNLTQGEDLEMNPIGRPNFSSWLETAEAVSSCDLVITVDTGVAHLAGAMGVPTYVILPGAAAWQYPLYHEYHPLYQSMRIFRNSGEGINNAVEAVIDKVSTL